jgi:hypothetical protein
MLRKFKTNDDFPIAPDDIRVEGHVLKGYLLSQFQDAFTRYLSNTPPAQPLHRDKLTAMGTSATFTTATPKINVAVGKCEKSNNDVHCSGVAVENPREGLEVHKANGGGRRCDHCGQPGPLAQCFLADRLDGVWLHKRCEAPWFDSERGAA